MGLIPESRGSAGGGHGNPLQYSCMENPMDRGAGGLQSRGHKELDMTEATDCACEMKTVPTERHRSGGQMDIQSHHWLSVPANTFQFHAIPTGSPNIL